MDITVLAFGIAKDIFGATTVTVSLPGNSDIADLKASLEGKYPKLKHIASYMIAVNNEYAVDALIVNERDEVAVIPPVSGG